MIIRKLVDFTLISTYIFIFLAAKSEQSYYMTLLKRLKSNALEFDRILNPHHIVADF